MAAPKIKKATSEETKEEYRVRIMSDICSKVSQKQTLMQICSAPDMPCYDTIYQWMNESETLSDMYARARQRRSFARSDRIDELTQMVISGALDAQSARVVIDAEKWQASKEHARVFGDKTMLSGDPDNPLMVVAREMTEQELLQIAGGNK